MASLPNKQFLCNYNARDFVASSKTISNASGALFAEDMVLNKVPSAVNDTYLTIQKGCYFQKNFASFDANPFNRLGSEKLTIIAKTSLTNNSAGNIVSNRTGYNVNWIFRNDAVGQTYLGGQSGPAPVLTATTTSANTYAYLRFYDGVDNYIAKSYTDNVSASTASYGWGSIKSDRFEIFTNAYINEPWGGDFYWLYISPEELTEAEIQQVITFNEYGSSITVTPSEVELSKWGESSAITVEAEYDWTGSTQDSWITLNPSTGESGTTTITVTASKNESGSRRTGTISFINLDEDTAEVTVGQNYIGNEVPINNLRLGTLSIN